MEKILVVEDSKEVLNNILQLLNFKGYNAIGAENGKMGIEQAKEHMPDLIVSDIMMPEVDGFKLLTELKNDPKTDSIPFIFLTAKVDRTDMRKGMVSGSDDFIAKPFKAQELLEAVETQLRKKKKHEDLFNEIFRNISAYVPQELRTPLVAIFGYTDLLIHDIEKISINESVQMLNAIRSSAHRLHKTLEKFILFSEVEVLIKDKRSNKELLSSITTTPSLYIHEIINSLNREYSQKDLFETKLHDFNICIFEEHFKYIVKELLENALKFSKQDKPVEVNSYLDQSFYKLEITNYGRGMTQEEIAKIRPFLQHKRDVHEQAGNGLGLVTVKRLIEFYNGDIEIESDAETYSKLIISLKSVQPN